MKSKKKLPLAYKMVLAIIMIILGIQLIYIFLFGVENKIVTPKKNCITSEEKLKKIRTIGDIDLYTYCIKNINFIGTDNTLSSLDDLKKGSHYYTMYSDGGTEIYHGLNYSIVDCQELNDVHVKYIISKKGYEDYAWKFCHSKN